MLQPTSERAPEQSHSSVEAELPTERVGRGKDSRPRKLAAALVAVTASVLAIAMWTVIPLAAVWFASKTAPTQFPHTVSYIVCITGTVTLMAVVGWTVAVLGRIHSRLRFGPQIKKPKRARIINPLSDERSVEAPQLVERVMFVSIALSVIAGAIWFFLFSKSPLGSF